MTTRLSIILHLVAAGAVAAAAVSDLWVTPTSRVYYGPQQPATPPVTTSPGVTLPTGHAGTDACRNCHLDQYEQWESSTHGTAGGPPGPETVIAPFDGQEIRFADAVVRPAIDATGTYSFTVERQGRPPLRYLVSGVVGKGHMVGGGTQGFVSPFADGTLRFLPFDYSADSQSWFCNTAFVGGFWVPGAERAQLRADAGWLRISNDLRLSECGDWPPVRILGSNRRFANCQNCHGSQINVEYSPELQRYESQVTSLAINCESCHGPGAEHVALANSGALATSPDLGLLALDTLGTDQALGVCFACHALKRALEPPDYSLGLPVVGDSPYLPDGRIRTFGYQQTHRSSACYLSGQMTCTDCHDPHSQSYQDPFGRALAGRFDDSQCTICHASKATEPEIHTFHPPGSSGAACVACHMPYQQHPELGTDVPYARSDHSIAIPRPGFDESAGLVSACAGCHQDRSVAELATQVEVWWGPVRPHRPEVAALIALAAPEAGLAEQDAALVVAAAQGSRYGLAKLMALNSWVEAQAVPSGQAPGTAGDNPGLTDQAGRALATLVQDDDEDVQAVAAAALHVVRGENADVRALLDQVQRRAAEPERLRIRWAAALGQWAESRRRQVGQLATLPFLRRAQEVRPNAPESLISLASGLAASGNAEQAVQLYLEALRHAPMDVVALVNLGVGLESLGRIEEAERVYERAVQIRPTEALAHLNLGNARLRRGDYDGAIAAYMAAVQNDPGLMRANLYLGVALANTGRATAALEFLYNAREFAPDDAEVEVIIRQVEEAIRGGEMPVRSHPWLPSN